MSRLINNQKTPIIADISLTSRDPSTFLLTLTPFLLPTISHIQHIRSHHGGLDCYSITASDDDPRHEGFAGML